MMSYEIRLGFLHGIIGVELSIFVAPHSRDRESSGENWFQPSSTQQAIIPG
jgi:hypothetical protein